MTPAEFKRRLDAATRRGRLTASDLAVWFSFPRSTIATWLWRVSMPREGSQFDELQRRLLLLEQSTAFPVPYEVRKNARRGYIEKAYADAVTRGVPARRSAV